MWITFRVSHTKMIQKSPTIYNQKCSIFVLFIKVTNIDCNPYWPCPTRRWSVYRRAGQQGKTTFEILFFIYFLNFGLKLHIKKKEAKNRLQNNTKWPGEPLQLSQLQVLYMSSLNNLFLPMYGSIFQRVTVIVAHSCGPLSYYVYLSWKPLKFS